MHKRLLALALFLTFLSSNLTFAEDEQNNNFHHVLLISVDGLHALDLANYIKANPTSALAQLSHHGTTYTNARTPANSDSFPGLLALVTGGSPITTGLFYDVSYDRTIFDPTNTTCSGTPGNLMVFDESIDQYNASNVSLDVINPTALPRHIDKHGKCVALFPHEALRTNTIFEVVKEKGGHTAWADKHPAYDLVNGPSGAGVDDLYTPEITNVNGLDATGSVVCTVENDRKKVNAILNEIHGLDHTGTHHAGAPALFGMNFQAVSVGQKLQKDNNDGSCTGDTLFTGQQGGYTDGDGTPSAVLKYGLQKTDESLGQMVQALKDTGLFDSTLVIISAKHGQSPINFNLLKKPGHIADLVAQDAADPGAAAIVNAGACSTGACGAVSDDDVALIWLQNQSDTNAVRKYLNANVGKLFIEEVMAGAELKLRFNDPANDSRTPDVIVQPVYGTIYTTSSKKIAEHGGFSWGDTNVGLLVSNPNLPARVLKTPVATSQVAPTILKALGIQPNELKSVRVEGTETLPH